MISEKDLAVYLRNINEELMAVTKLCSPESSMELLAEMYGRADLLNRIMNDLQDGKIK